MDRHWHNGISIRDSEVHRSIVELNFPKIYTTNFDFWIEKAYEHYQRPYQKITNAKGLARAVQGSTQIIKLHGDFDDDSSLVLTESNYFDRLSFDSPLDVQLRADMLANSFLYIGYSLRDINMRLLCIGCRSKPLKMVLMETPPHRLYTCRGQTSSKKQS